MPNKLQKAFYGRQNQIYEKSAPTKESCPIKVIQHALIDFIQK